MKQYVRTTIGTIATFAIIFAAVLVTAPVAFARDPNAVTAPNEQCDTKADGSVKVNIVEGVDCSKGDQTQGTLFEEDADGNSLFKTITNVLLFLVGAISVIMLIIGGFKYVISNGDSAAVTSAKNTILYAVIGIIVALLAYAIVNFVVSSFIS